MVGIEASEYAPDVLTYTGRIGKIAREVIESESVPSKFNGLLKPIGEYGKDVELTLYKRATGSATTRTGAVTFNPPAGKTLLFKDWVQNTYPVRIDKLQIRESSTDESVAETNAERVIETLYNGAEYDKNQNGMGAFTSLAYGAPDEEGNTHIVGLIGVPEITDAASAEAFLLAVKDAAKLIREGSADVNPYGQNVPAKRVVMLTPMSNVTRVDVFKRTETEQLEYARFDVDEVIEYDPSMFANAEAATFIFDERFAQFYERENEYEETKAKGNRGVDACLYTNNMYGICPLFSAVRIPRSAK